MTQGRFAQFGKPVSLDTPITQAAKWIPDGTGPVVIEDLDAESAESEGYVWLVLKSEATKAMHKDRVWVLARGDSEFSVTMRQLLGATLPDLAAQRQFRTLLADATTSRRVLEALRGMRVLLTLKSNPGFRITFDRVARDYVAILGDGTEVARSPTLSETDRRAKALGHAKSFRKIHTIGVIDEDTTKANLAAFSNVVASITKATDADSVPEADFAGFTHRPA